VDACVAEASFACGPAVAPPTRWTENTPPSTWPAASLPVRVKIALPLSRDLGAAEIDEVDVALRTWSQVRCTSWRGVVDGTAAVSGDDDGVSSVVWHDDDWPATLTPNALAQTIVRTDAQGRTREIDLHVNAKDFKWSVDGRAGTIDLRGVLVHELGHALGLGHSDDTRATMYASGPQGFAWRSLEKDDIAGVCALYPGTGAPGCDRGGPACPAGFLCLADACERPRTAGALCAPCKREPGACAASGEEARCIDIANGRVCGRACATDADCGGRHRCQPTTQAGDLQCVPDDECASGPFSCRSDADCAPFVCRAGACVGPGEPRDAGAFDAGGGARDAAKVERTDEGGGCSAAPLRGVPHGATALVAVVVLLRRRRARGPTK
jgi:uncharacterized protein (TIGR03382 family)